MPPPVEPESEGGTLASSRSRQALIAGSCSRVNSACREGSCRWRHRLETCASLTCARRCIVSKGSEAPHQPVKGEERVRRAISIHTSAPIRAGGVYQGVLIVRSAVAGTGWRPPANWANQKLEHRSRRRPEARKLEKPALECIMYSKEQDAVSTSRCPVASVYKSRRALWQLQ